MKTRLFYIAILCAGLLACSGGSNSLNSSKEKRNSENKIKFIKASELIPAQPLYGDYGALWGDFNKDDQLDLIFMGHGIRGDDGGPVMLMQEPLGNFENVTTASGLKMDSWKYEKQSDRHGGSCADYNNDGNIDLFITHGANRGLTLGIKYDELLEGHGDFTFDDVTAVAGTLNQYGRGRVGTWVDYNNDGWLDLYVTNFKSDNILYRNNADGTFTDVTDIAGLRFQMARALWADYDFDGNIDLLLGWPLALFKNRGDGTFENVTDTVLINKDIFGYSYSFGDVDNDGDLDLFVSRLKFSSQLYINNNSFTLYDSDWGFSPGEVSTGASFGDLDNDGDLDIFQVRTDGYIVYENVGETTFKQVAIGKTIPNLSKNQGDSAIADFNNDGLLDAAIDNLDGYDLLENKTNSSNNWIKIRFEGDGVNNNKMGFGNKVWVTVDGALVAYREYRGDNSVLRSMGCGPIHIGLGQYEKVDIKVAWLDGAETNIFDVAVNKLVIISDVRPRRF